MMRFLQRILATGILLAIPSACGSFADLADKKSDDPNPIPSQELEEANAEAEPTGDVGGESQEIETSPVEEMINTQRSEPCGYRFVDHTNGNRLLVSNQAETGATILDRLHPGDSVFVLSRKAGRVIRDDLLNKSSGQWLEVTYQSGATSKRGWVNELYTTCADSCPFVEFYRLGTSVAVVRESPYEKDSKIVHRFYNHYMTKALDKIEDGVEVSDPEGGASSRSWYQVEYLDGTNPTAKKGWVSTQYAFCTQGRLQSRDGKLRLPVLSRYLSSHETDHTKRGSVYAWDINAPYGTPVYPIAPGVIKYAGCNNAGQYGCWTQIAHDNGMTTNMAHMIEGSIKVANGQRVTQDTVLGQVGWTGLTTFGPHTHLEIFVNGARVLLGNYFNQDAMMYCKTCSLKK